MSAQAGKDKIIFINKALEKIQDLLSLWTEKEIIAENPSEIERCKSEIRRLKEKEAELENELEQVSREYTHIEGDEVYELLCRLNFTHQTKYFESLLESRKTFLSFVIRGQQQDFGQEWLTHKLMHIAQKKKAIHKPISLDCEDLEVNLAKFIEYISRDLGVNDNVSKKRPREVRKALEDRIATKSQFVIIKNAHHFIHSEEFVDFLDVIQYFHDEIVNTHLGHKCIFIFLELRNNKPYLHTQYCMFSNETAAHRARKCEEFRFIDLDAIKPVPEAELEDWIESLPETIADSFDEILNNRDKMKTFIADGNPQKLIPIICEKLGKSYFEYESKWRKQ